MGIVVILVIIIYVGFFRKEGPTFILAEVSRGTVVQEVSETGQIGKGEEINLSFKSSGRIEKIYVEVGQEVELRDRLVKLNTTSLFIQLQEAKAALDLAKAKLNKLLAGSSSEEIQIAETGVANAQISLETAQENLDNSYEDALNTLDDAYLKIYNAFNVVYSVHYSYFQNSDQEGSTVNENKNIINNVVINVKPYLDQAKTTSAQGDIDTTLSEMRGGLEDVSEALRIIRETCESSYYRSLVSSTDKTSLDNQRSYINTVLTNVTNSQQTISVMKLNKETAEGQLQVAEDQLALVKSGPRQEDIELHQAQVKQAQAQVDLLENQITESTLTAPVVGQITEIHKEVGEQVQSLSDTVISLIPAAPFQIKSDIYEEDIVKIGVGNPVDVSLIVFPERVFEGRVISINPSEKLMEGVIYYEITIDCSELPSDVKPGMTADLIIQTALKDNVLVVPEETLQKKDGKRIVQVLEDGEVKDREIEVGLLGNNLVEVISGLKEGEKVVLE
jgi:RND family efflux transporter MFP subunit